MRQTAAVDTAGRPPSAFALIRGQEKPAPGVWCAGPICRPRTVCDLAAVRRTVPATGGCRNRPTAVDAPFKF